MIKLVRVCQMMMQFTQYKCEQQYSVQQMMEEDQNELQVGNNIILQSTAMECSVWSETNIV